jgi:hypothetical protein
MTTDAQKNCLAPLWYEILTGIYMVINLAIVVLFIAFPMIVVGPSFPLSALQLGIFIVIDHLTKAACSFLLLEGERYCIFVVLLALCCLWNTWLESPFHWSNPTIILLLLDWLVLGVTIYILQKKR